MKKFQVHLSHIPTLNCFRAESGQFRQDRLQLHSTNVTVSIFHSNVRPDDSVLHMFVLMN
jgi:hypothetical protein